eukprot:3864712-Pyramimonas_sp.AAC.1
MPDGPTLGGRPTRHARVKLTMARSISSLPPFLPSTLPPLPSSLLARVLVTSKPRSLEDARLVGEGPHAGEVEDGAPGAARGKRDRQEGAWDSGKCDATEGERKIEKGDGDGGENR